MLCEHANPYLVEYAENALAADLHAQVGEHLQGCETCQSDFQAIAGWRSMASNWHDEVVPNWKPAPITGHTGRDLLESLRLWFPTAASTAALAMATLIFVQMPQNTPGALPTQQPMAASYDSLPPLPQATQAAMVQSVMEGSREQRQEELQALLKILKAEMDRRSIETEESMRFIISNQLQGQQELDELYKQVEAVIGPTAATDIQTTPRIESVPKAAVNR